MITCRDFAGRVWSHLDGEEGWSGWLQMSAHAAICGPCAEYRRQARATLDALRGLGGVAPEPPPEVLAAFRAWQQAKSDEGPQGSGGGPKGS